MKVFLSYRRDDTGGRAGRLFDVLVARFGVRNVFQDVNTVAPGLDFIAQVEAAIETMPSSSCAPRSLRRHLRHKRQRRLLGHRRPRRGAYRWATVRRA